VSAGVASTSFASEAGRLSPGDAAALTARFAEAISQDMAMPTAIAVAQAVELGERHGYSERWTASGRDHLTEGSRVQDSHRTAGLGRPKELLPRFNAIFFH